MDEDKAIQIAAIFGGEPWGSGGGIWLVKRRRSDGKVVVFSDELVAVYASEEDAEAGQPENSILIV